MQQSGHAGCHPRRQSQVEEDHPQTIHGTEMVTSIMVVVMMELQEPLPVTWMGLGSELPVIISMDGLACVKESPFLSCQRFLLCGIGGIRTLDRTAAPLDIMRFSCEPWLASPLT